MGSGKFNPHEYRAFAATTKGKTTEEIYTSTEIDKDLDPKGVKVRESRDSADNPNSTPVIVAIDVTGSMGIIADVIARTGLGILFNEILTHKPIPNPHLMFMAIGDATVDRYPLQVSQFEADNRIVDQLTKIFLEKGGGGNNHESYDLPWYFAANHTAHDSMEKRGKRGYLFTIGDEETPNVLSERAIKKFIGDSVEADQDSDASLRDARRLYDVYHVIIEEGNYARSYGPEVSKKWRDLLGQKVINLSDHTKLAETIVGAITIAEGADHAVVDKRYGKSVSSAVKNLKPVVRPMLTLP